MMKLYIMTGLFLLFAGICIYLFLSNRRLQEKCRILENDQSLREKKRINDIKSGTALKQMEFLALQNQINPHFLYNTLEAIRGDAISEGVQGIADTTKALATFFRYTITDVGRMVVLEDEIHNVESYFVIQKYRFGEKLDLDIQYPEGQEELLSAEIPKLTLQPIVENAISHGLEQKVGKGSVKIVIDCIDRRLRIQVKDDGIGIDEKKRDELNEVLEGNTGERQNGKGIALRNVNSRIKLMFGDDYGLHIYGMEGVGTTVIIQMPFILRGKKQGSNEA